MRVNELMIIDVKRCDPADSLNRAAQLMWEVDCGSIPVVDDGSRLVGMLTDRDICMAAYTQGLPLSRMGVRSAMADTVHACGPKDSLETALSIMGAQRVRRLPVVDERGALVGIVSLNDIALAIQRQPRAQDRRALSDALAEALASICAPRPQAPAWSQSEPVDELVGVGS
jgi:CBS domain-containing protein